MDVYNEVYASPYFCYINLTSKCNLRCKHCLGRYSFPQDNELNFEEWKNVVDNLIKCKVFFVNISGGEPTQSPYFRDFINYLSKRGVHFILTTNGVFSNEIRDFIIKNKEYLIGIKISLDGPDKESHGYLRLDSNEEYNPKLFETTMKNIFFFKKEKIPLTIASVLHKENIDKMDEFRKLIKKINPISWFISPIIPVGRGNENKFISGFYEYLNKDLWKKILEDGGKDKINIRLIDLPIELKKEGLPAYTCPAAINFCEIHSDGVVSPCTLCRVCIPKEFLKFENIKNNSLQNIWDGESFNKFRNYMNMGCDGCKMLSKCNKCIAQSFRYFNSGEFPTPYCVKNGERLGLKNQEKYKEILEDKFNIILK